MIHTKLRVVIISGGSNELGGYSCLFLLGKYMEQILKTINLKLFLNLLSFKICTMGPWDGEYTGVVNIMFCTFLYVWSVS